MAWVRRRRLTMTESLTSVARELIWDDVISVHAAGVRGVLRMRTGAGVAKKTLRIALVGVGAAAQINHIPALKKLEDVELVALCDRDPEKAARVAQKFQIPRAHGRLDELLK